MYKMTQDYPQPFWPDSQTAREAADALLAYYDQEGRTLPWRGESNLYRIWISEIMLQQTGVTTVIPYYHRFLDRFETIQKLARAELSQVLHQWQGLGYYRRAQNLHAAAVRIQEEYGGIFPEDLEQLEELPGIGPSTAAAILAIGRNQPHAILDGNVKRVLSRRMGLTESVEGGPGKKILWQMARLLTPEQRPGDYAQAIMDLGATLCTRKNPDCLRCPWQNACQAHKLGCEEAFPVKKTTGKSKPRRTHYAVLLFRPDETLLMQRRPTGGLLGGLWQPVSGEWGERENGSKRKPTQGDIRQLLSERGIISENVRSLGVVTHTFTHFHLTVHTFQADYREGPLRGWSDDSCRWLAQGEIAELACSTLDKKILALGNYPD